MPPRQRILCAEDDDDSCFLLKTLLEREGYEVETANTAKAVLEIAERESFDLFTLDNGYLDGTGLELCKQLHERYPEVPIMFYSGDVREGIRQEAFKAGARAYILKPEIDGMVEAIKQLLNEASRS